MKIRKLMEYNLGAKPKQVRTCEVDLGYEKGRLFVWSEHQDCDPWDADYTSPQYPLHFSMYGAQGQLLWQKDLGMGVPPGVWFCPFIALDLDGDGVDEIWFVNNTTHRPFELRTRVLERLDALTGETLGTWPFPAINTGLLIMCQAYRYMLIGGYVHGQPVIIMEQGTYENMYFQCYNADMSLRWERVIEKDEGPRAAHSVPVMDWNKDGVDEMWFGEHLMSLDTGEDLFCMARDSYFGHSDVVAPFTDFSTGKRYIFTCREGANYKGCPRIVMFNEDGTVAWQDVYENPDEGKDGHINGGFVFLDKTGRRIAVGKHIRPGVQFVYDAVTGEKLEPAMDYFYLRPVDLNGDGCHEFLRKQRGKPLAVLDTDGTLVVVTGGTMIAVVRNDGMAGEQFLCYYEQEGIVRLWGDEDAKDSALLLARHADGFHTFMNKMTGNGYNFESTVDCIG